MDPETQGTIRSQAIDWHIRLRDGDDADWIAFEEWLAVSTDHAKAYQRVEQADLELDPLLAQVQFREAANDTEPAGRRSWRWPILAGALAASVALALVLPPLLLRDTYEVTTSPGENQIVSLDAGTRITLNGSTRMIFDRRDPRYAELAVGEALFHVRHDDRNAFRVKVGNNVVEDAGTVFNVVYEAGTTRVAVAEGKVLYNPGRDQVALDPGEALTDADATIRVVDVPSETVGAWQRGRLSYRGEPLSQVAADLTRSLGRPITLSPELTDSPFNGTIALDGPAETQIEHLRLVLNLRVEAEGERWVVKPLDARR